MNHHDIIDVVTLPMLKSTLENGCINTDIIKHEWGFEAISATSIGKNTYYAIVENNILTLFAEIKIAKLGDVNFTVYVHASELGVTAIPSEFGYFLKSESLVTNGMTIGAIIKTFDHFQSSLDRVWPLAEELTEQLA
jgi:hypothetical protein